MTKAEIILAKKEIARFVTMFLNSCLPRGVRKRLYEGKG